MPVTTMFERRLIPSYGLQDREDSKMLAVHVVTAKGEETGPTRKANVRMNRDDNVAVVDSCGDGGSGRPATKQEN